jgi:hypothetical protein
MKKIVLFTLIASIALVSGVYPRERADVVESITPSPVTLFIKTSRIRNFLVSLKFVADNLLSDERAGAMKNKTDGLKNKTGLDIIDIASLEKAGIDVDRSVGFAMYPDGTRGEERMLIFLPVQDEKIFPLKFVELLKKSAGSETADVYPVITQYSDHTMYQIRRDIFTTALEGVFVIGSTGELVRSVIDAKVKNEGHLALDLGYIDSLAKNAGNYDLRAFASRDFLKEVIRGRRKPVDEKKGQGGDKPVSLMDVPSRVVAYAAGAPGMLVSVDSEIDRLSSGPSLFNAVEYAFLGLSANPAAVDIDLAVKFNRTSGTVNTFLDVIRTGGNARALAMKNATALIFASFDYGKIDDLCRGNAPGCDYYASFKERVKEDLGIDFQADIVPSFSGVMNMVTGEPKGAGSGYALYLPMNDPDRSGKILEKAAAYLKEKYKGTERFGPVTIGGAKCFWYYGAKSGKTYIGRDRKGLYMASDADLMAAAMAGKESSQVQLAGGAPRKIGENVFFLTTLKRDSFFGAMLLLYGSRNGDVGGFAGKIQELSAVSEKIGDYVTLGINLNLAKRK